MALPEESTVLPSASRIRGVGLEGNRGLMVENTFKLTFLETYTSILYFTHEYKYSLATREYFQFYTTFVHVE